ncbi:MAG: hypothetical protein ACPGO3_13880 [Magnetospiraceae bacterium]
MPSTADGKIEREPAIAWMEANLDPGRRKKSAGDAPPDSHSHSLPSLKEEHELVKIQRARIALERERGALVDRAAAESAILARARAERDQHLAFVSRVAPILAGELGIDPGDLFRLMDKHMREHLARLSETRLDEL